MGLLRVAVGVVSEVSSIYMVLFPFARLEFNVVSLPVTCTHGLAVVVSIVKNSDLIDVVGFIPQFSFTVSWV